MKHLEHVEVFVPAICQCISYSDFVAKLFKIDTDQMELCHLGMAIPGEAGELADAIKKHVIYGKELDVNNVIEELGDIAFFLQALMNKLELNWEAVLQANANKLSKRYPKGEYRAEDAIERKDKAVDNVTDQTQVGVAELHWGLNASQLGNG